MPIFLVIKLTISILNIKSLIYFLNSKTIKLIIDFNLFVLTFFI